MIARRRDRRDVGLPVGRRSTAYARVLKDTSEFRIVGERETRARPAAEFHHFLPVARVAGNAAFARLSVKMQRARTV